jgi:lysophospholipase L1-like esterase
VCPLPVTVQSLDGNASPVVYEPPDVIAGQPPLQTACSPVTGSVFQLGSSTVACSTTDAAGRSAACTFVVTLTAPPRLSVTKFMAFGNSITAGEPGNNYPAHLRTMLRARYTAQSQVITVFDQGVGGEVTEDGADRLPDALDDFRPDVLLLEEGINDLSGGNQSNLPPMIDGLEDMVREAKRRGVKVLLATLLPERPGTAKTSAHPLIIPANNLIRALAARENVALVDLYAGFGGGPEPYISEDGLHPNALGYQKMAELFLDAIRSNLETAPPEVPSIQLVRNGPF